VYRTYRRIQDSERSQRLLSFGGRVQRLLWASTSTKDPASPDDLYVRGLAAPGTVNTMPDTTLEAFFDHGTLSGVLAADGGGCDETLAAFAAAGVDVAALAATLQKDGAEAFVASWTDLMAHIAEQLAAA
jgi:transaldolase